MELLSNGLTAITKMGARFGSSERYWAKKCVPTNTALSGPLSGPLNTVEGAMGGLMFSLVSVVIVALAVGAIITILSRKAPALLKAIALVAAIPLVVIAVLIVFDALYAALNKSC